MIEYTPESFLIRKAIECELRAARGNLDQAISELTMDAEQARSRGDTSAATWLFLKAGELLCADCRYDAAWEINTRLAPLIPDVPERLQTVAKQNFSLVGLNVGDIDSHRDFYEAVDQESRLDRNRDTEGLLYAEQASREQKHYDSLPPLWRDLTASYLSGDWGARKRAHSRLALETLAAGWIGQCVHHCIYGGNIEVVRPLTEWLIKWRNPDLVNVTIKTAISTTLCGHARICAEIIAPLADVTPEALLPAVVDWALHCAVSPRLTRHTTSSVSACWRCLGRLSFRLSSGQATRVAEALLQHAFFGPPQHGRDVAVEVLRACLSRIREYEWRDLAQRVLPLAQEHRWDGDFREVLDLLVFIAEQDPDAKSIIADALAPKGTSISNLYLMRCLPKLGRSPGAENVARMAKAVAPLIEEQVWSGTGSPPRPKLSAPMEKQVGDGQRVQRVLVQGGVLELNVILANKEFLTPESLAPLMNSIAYVVRDPLNVIANRICAFEFLERVYDRMSRAQAITAYDLLLPFADGTWTIMSPAEGPPESTTARLRFIGPSLADQRGAALLALFRIANTHRVRPHQTSQLVSDAMMCPEAAVRAAGCTALTTLSSVSRSQTIALIAAMQDADTKVAVAAYGAITRLLGGDRRVKFISSIIAVARRNVFSPAPIVRYRIALLIKALGNSRLAPPDRAQLIQVIAKLQSDLNHSVRSAIA